MLQFVCAACSRTRYTCGGRVLVKDLYLYRRWRLYGVDTDMPVDRQGHNVHSCSWTHMQKNVPSPKTEHVSTGRPKIKTATDSSICVWKATLPHFVFMIFHHLPFYCRFIFCLTGGIFISLAYQGIVSTWQEDTGAKHGEENAPLPAVWLYIGRLLYSTSWSTCEAQHFSVGSSGEKSEGGLNIEGETWQENAIKQHCAMSSQSCRTEFLQKKVWK